MVWAVGDWGACLQPNSTLPLQCGIGVRTRAVTCRAAASSSGGNDSSTGSSAVDVASCAAGALSPPPVAVQPCAAPPCPCASSADCDDLTGHHVCDDAGRCVCGSGWAGSDCGTIELLPVNDDGCGAATVVDVNGVCCDATSAIDSVTGVCCGVGVVTDGDGRCCGVGVAVDACGVCGGDGVVVDVAGQCCSQPLSPSGLCCTGVLDSCGVCDGTNDCAALVTAALPVDATALSIASAIGLPVSLIVNFTAMPSMSDQVRCRRCCAPILFESF